MNWRLGLHRVSAVFWGMWGAASLFMTGAILYQGLDGTMDALTIFGTGLGALAFFYGAHRVSCWVIDGFTRP